MLLLKVSCEDSTDSTGSSFGGDIVKLRDVAIVVVLQLVLAVVSRNDCGCSQIYFLSEASRLGDSPY